MNTRTKMTSRVAPVLRFALGFALGFAAAPLWALGGSGAPPQADHEAEAPAADDVAGSILPRTPGIENPPIEAGPDDETADLESADDDRPRFGRRPFGRQRPRMNYDSLSQAERDRVERFIEKHFPDRYEELSKLDDRAPHRFEVVMNQMLPQIMRLMRMETDEPEAFPARLEEVRISLHVRSIVPRLRESGDPAEREALLAEVRGLIERRFDLQQQFHRAEIERLEHRLAEARDRLERRESAKQRIIAGELEDISSGRPSSDRPPSPRRDRRPNPRGR